MRDNFFSSYVHWVHGAMVRRLIQKCISFKLNAEHL